MTEEVQTVFYYKGKIFSNVCNANLSKNFDDCLTRSRNKEITTESQLLKCGRSAMKSVIKCFIRQDKFELATLVQYDLNEKFSKKLINHLKQVEMKNSNHPNDSNESKEPKS